MFQEGLPRRSPAGSRGALRGARALCFVSPWSLIHLPSPRKTGRQDPTLLWAPGSEVQSSHESALFPQGPACPPSFTYSYTTLREGAPPLCTCSVLESILHHSCRRSAKGLVECFTARAFLPAVGRSFHLAAPLELSPTCCKEP